MLVQEGIDTAGVDTDGALQACFLVHGILQVGHEGSVGVATVEIPGKPLASLVESWCLPLFGLLTRHVYLRQFFGLQGLAGVGSVDVAE